MEGMDQRLVSIFDTEKNTPELVESMRDIVKLAGVISELNKEDYFRSPIQILKVLRILNVIQEEALGLDKKIEDEMTIYYRYRNTYGEDEDVTPERIKRLVFLLSKYNWIMKTSNRIKMHSLGKRMMDMLIRLANDSLAYYMYDDIARSLFQAKRDAEISEAYDDRGISGGNRLASMIKNVEEAVFLLKDRELEFLADRHAIDQVQLINHLMEDLEIKQKERFEALETVEEGIPYASLMKDGIRIISEGMKISIGTINKILKFTQLQENRHVQTIRPETFRNFISQSYDSPLESDIPNTHQILSFMEQGVYENEDLDGMWIPVKFASPITTGDIHQGIEYIENYEPMTVEIEEPEELEYAAALELEDFEIEAKLEDSRWQMTKQLIPTEHIEAYLEEVDEAQLEELVKEVGSASWADVINSLIGVSAIISNRRAEFTDKQKESQEVKIEDKEWEWMEDDEHNAKSVRRRKRGTEL